jgi:hypothetical protein
MPHPLGCPRCGSPSSIAEDVIGYLDWGDAIVGDDGIVRPAGHEPQPPTVMADNSETVGKPRGCCNNPDCRHQWRLRRKFDPTA